MRTAAAIREDLRGIASPGAGFDLRAAGTDAGVDLRAAGAGEGSSESFTLFSLWQAHTAMHRQDHH